MKLCIIFSDFGKTAPGIVYKTLITQIMEMNNVSLLSLDGDVPISANVLPVAKIGIEHYRIEELFFTLLGLNPLDHLWLNRQKKLIDERVIKEQDIIISFTSFHNYRSILLGDYLANKYNKKWVIYSVDAMPAPLGWVCNKFYHKRLKNYITGYISRSNAFFSANQQMLDYQLNAIDTSNKITGSVFTPICKVSHDVVLTSDKNPVLLYTGGLYGPRKKEALLDGFRLFLKDYPKAKICFVGKYKPNFFKLYDDLVCSGNIEIYAYTNDLSQHYSKSTILIDLNAYFDNDVFLSSKIVNYLAIKKPILSITGDNSPARNIFTKDPSIFHSQHNSVEIYNTLKKIASIEFNNWEGREYYINKFKVEKVTLDFINQIKGLVK